MEKVCVVGFGAIGALYAFALEKSSKVEVTAVCRSNYEAIQEHGLRIESDRFGSHPSWHPHRVVRTVEEAANERYSYIVCATKCLPDVRPTSNILAPLLDALDETSSTSIVLLQNGVGIEDDIFEALSRRDLSNPVISGCAWVDATMVDSGKAITQHGKEELVIGYHKPPGPSAFSEDTSKVALGHFSDILQSAGAAVKVSEIDVARWRKVLWNASFSTVCTLTRARVGDVLAVPEARASLREIMEEVLLVARACLPNDGFVKSILHATVAQDVVNNENPASVFKPSMFVDLESGRPIEVEAIVGGILRRAREKGIATPRLDLIYAGLKVIQQGLISHKNST
ncbi:ketopantoate reductase PanE/ApbA C terminal-domain-containing protein [Irpex rosettiformis]|uniref:Ketopantoate reductase PanE/ApbA C terminal-domain-containing protein n=1 Tax=Irpex rosettiformis TaxID=378272 RepID=A0ACB8TYB8_9APHY|nr:ketopantoate reductase PanE/ApbA C terminal-domain-containing protein [Irpex rosettiformis]